MVPFELEILKLLTVASRARVSIDWSPVSAVCTQIAHIFASVKSK